MLILEKNAQAESFGSLFTVIKVGLVGDLAVGSNFVLNLSMNQ